MRYGAAFGVSAVVHVLLLAAFMLQPWRPYALPEVAPPPEEMEIVRSPIEPPIPPVVIPPLPTPQPPTPTQPPQAQPTPPKVAPTPTPTPPRFVTSHVVTAPSPTPAPSAARPIPSQTFTAVPVPELTPAPSPQPAPVAPPAPARPAPAAQPAPTAAQLNLHKSEREAPTGVPTLPMAPAPSAPRGGPPAPGGGGGPVGGSRLNGLNPYPGGVLPSGSGLRGSLVGCANAEAVGLSSVERSHCAERFGGSAGTAPHLDPISPARRAAFDKAVERADRDRAYRNSSTSAGMATGMGGIAPQESGSTVKLPK